MDVGVFLAINETIPPERFAETVRDVEERDFAAIWVPEHVVLFRDYEPSYPYAPDGRLRGLGEGMMEPFAALTFAAAHSSRIRLGTSICLVAQRNPVYTAKQVADLDYLSGGRVNFGIGMGWQREEFEALQMPWERRGRRGDEHIAVMKALWENEVSSFEGEFYRLPDCVQYPKPVQKPHPPIFVGGEGDAALRRAARLGQGWMGAGVNPEDMPERIETLHRFLREAGRAPDDCAIYALPNRRPDTDRFQRLADAGVEHVIHMVPIRSRDETRAGLDDLLRLAGK
jgi:probable F420-dependent oxidoreductase